MGGSEFLLRIGIDARLRKMQDAWRRRFWGWSPFFGAIAYA